MGEPPAATAAGRASGSERLQQRYLDLLKGCLTRDLFATEEYIDATWWPSFGPLGDPDEVWTVLNARGWRLIRPVDANGTGKAHVPASAETMVGRARLDNVEDLVRLLIADDVPGDLVETGVWRGGTVILMRALLEALDDQDRAVWACDSFEGLPEPDLGSYPADASMVIKDRNAASMVAAGLAVPVEEVRANFARYGLLDDRVRFLEGWFADTLPDAPIERIGLLRLDGDYYESTMDALVHLEPKVSPGGFVIVDDYGALDACRDAVTDYRTREGIDEPIVEVDWTGVYWRKSAPQG